MKKLINDIESIVDEMIEGIITSHPTILKRLPNTSVITRVDVPIQGKVGIVSGGGSGHEPAHAGYVGKGMLDAAVIGEVFTSPTPDQILEAIKAVNGGEGVLLIIKNYTGDVLNFEMAKELADLEGIEVAEVIVNDDVAVEDSTFTTGRRGIAGTIFVHKIAGALAENGSTLMEIKETCDKVISNIRSMGVALSSCTVPAAKKPSFQLKENEMEIGIGIHGEPGIARVAIRQADEIVTTLVSKIQEDLDFTNSEIALMINGLGATPEMELYVVSRKVNEWAKANNIHIIQSWIGEYMTSLEMAGFSITFFKLNKEWKDLLRQDVHTLKFHV